MLLARRHVRALMLIVAGAIKFHTPHVGSGVRVIRFGHRNVEVNLLSARALAYFVLPRAVVAKWNPAVFAVPADNLSEDNNLARVKRLYQCVAQNRF